MLLLHPGSTLVSRQGNIIQIKRLVDRSDFLMKKLTLAAQAALLGATFLLSACQTTPPPTKDTSQWWSHIKVLASDRLQGRLTGSEGYEEAASYVAESFKRYGLEPAGADGYLQPVSYDVQTILPDQSTISLTDSAGVSQSLKLGDDMVLAAGAEQLPLVTAPLVFIGYGLSLPEAGYDDFKDLDLRGKIAVYLSGAPANIPGPLQAYGRAEMLARSLEASGALGAIAIQTPAVMEVPWERIKLASLQPGMYLSEPDLRRYHKPSLIGSVNPAAAGKIFAGAPASFEQLAALSDAHQPMPHFPLPLTLHAQVTATHAVVKANNVVGELPGSDAGLAEQAVVLSAHLDHLGTGKPDHGDGIFHGVMDNASGVASLLEVARSLQASGARPRRSILFIAVGGEEKGLLGSRYFAAHPTRHVGQLVADINMDMFLPLFPLRRLVAFGADESSLGGDAVAIAKNRGLAIVPDPAPDHLIFVRSDQYSFIRRGVPSLMLQFAATPGSDEEILQTGWRQQRYHAQADDLQQPIDLAAADDFNKFLVALISRVANQPQAPAWRDASFFRRFAQNPLK